LIKVPKLHLRKAFIGSNNAEKRAKKQFKATTALNKVGIPILTFRLQWLWLKTIIIKIRRALKRYIAR
jgi:hypothetical protein